MTVIVIAHRTCPEHAPENSIAGIRCAAALGADAVEVDVRLTRDRVPVLMHDARLRRTVGDSDWVHRCTLADLGRYRLANGEPIPTLADALSALPAGLRMAIEVKSAGTVDPVLAVVAEQHRGADVLLWSKLPSFVAAVARRDIGIETALLRDTFTPWGHVRYLRAARELGAGAISARWEAITPEFAARARDAGLRIYSWCRRASVERERVELIDGLVTDWPAEARVAL